MGELREAVIVSVEKKKTAVPVKTGHGSAGAPQRMQPRPFRGLESVEGVSEEELQQRQDNFSLRRRPTKFGHVKHAEVDEDTIEVPDVPPTPSD